MSDFESLLPQLKQWYWQMEALPRYIGPGQMHDRVHREQSCYLNNAVLNCNAGHIYFAGGSFVGYGALISTCTHNADAKGEARRSYPTEGRDIRIGREVWIASGSIVLGPCTIGDYSVVAAGAVVLRGDYPGGVLIGGHPARVIRPLRFDEHPIQNPDSPLAKEGVDATPNPDRSQTFLPLKSQPRVLLLSLARAEERRRNSVDQLRAEGADFEIVDGVDGREVPNLPQKRPREMRNTIVGCYLSHLRAYERMVAYDWPHAVILEDDFKLLRPGELGRVFEGIPPDWDHLMLHQFRYGDGGGLRVVEKGEKFNRLQPCGVCTHGYAISRQFAEYMLANHALPERPFDLALREVSKDSRFTFLELASPLIGLTGAPSLINEPLP